MWNWIADEIEKEQMLHNIEILKTRWCTKHRVSPFMHCFACEYCGDRECKAGCLFNWDETDSFIVCGGVKGYYFRCNVADIWQEQAALARKIANLPVREEV